MNDQITSILPARKLISMATQSSELPTRKPSENLIGSIWLRKSIEVVEKELEFVIIGEKELRLFLMDFYKFKFLAPLQKLIYGPKDVKLLISFNIYAVMMLIFQSVSFEMKFLLNLNLKNESLKFTNVIIKFSNLSSNLIKSLCAITSKSDKND